MTDTSDDALDRLVREAVATLVHTAPAPRPYGELAIAPAPHRPGRWWVAVAAAVIALAGVVGMAAAIQSRDRGSAPATIPAATSLPAPEATDHATTPATASTVPTTRPPLPDPTGMTTGPFPDVPRGSIDAAPGDLLGLTTDGNVSLYRDPLAADPGEPVILADGFLTPGRIFVGLAAVGPVNGSLLTNLPVDFETDQPSQVTTLSQPGAQPVPLVNGSLGDVSHDGTRFLVHEHVGVRNELAAYDIANGTVTRRGTAAFPGGGGTLLWSDDDRELYSYVADNGERQAVLTRIDSTTLEVVDSTVVEEWDLGHFGPTDHPFLLGVWDGYLMFATGNAGIRAYTMPGMIPADLEVPAWLPTVTNVVTSLDIAADGRTAAWVGNGTTYVQTVGSEPVAVRDNLVEVAFVDPVTADTPAPPAEIPGLFPVDSDPALSTFTAVAPSGSIDAAAGDMISVAADGDVWLHPGAFDPPRYGRSPAAPIRLVAMSDPRLPVTEGEGPNHVSSAGFVNGALVYGSCCEPVSGSLYAVSETDGPGTDIAVGYDAAADRSARRWAMIDPSGIRLLDYDTGRGVRRFVETAPDGSFQQFNAVTWSPDESELWVFASVWNDEPTNVLIRYRADATLTELERRELDRGQPGELPGIDVAGRLADGTVVVSQQSADHTIALRYFAAGANEQPEGPAWVLPTDATGVSVSPDGTTLAYAVDDTAYLQREGQAPVEWGTDVTRVWFVTTPALPIGTDDCVPPPSPEFDYLTPQHFADLDGDGVSERLLHATDGPLYWIEPCGTASDLPRIELYRSGRDLIPIDVEGDGQTELWVSSGDYNGSVPDLPCVVLARLDGTTLVSYTESRCIGDVGFGCVGIDGVVQPVFYERDGLTLTATLDDGTVLGTHTYTSEAEFADLFDLAC